MDSDGHSDILVCSDHSSSWFDKTKFDWLSLFRFPVSGWGCREPQVEGVLVVAFSLPVKLEPISNFHNLKKL